MPVGVGVTDLLCQSFVTGGVEASEDDGDSTRTAETALDRSTWCLRQLALASNTCSVHTPIMERLPRRRKPLVPVGSAVMVVSGVPPVPSADESIAC